MFWRNVKRRLPKVGQNVLIYTTDGNVGEGNLIDDGGWVQYRWGVPLVKVTHWKPLPPPPVASNNWFKRIRLWLTA